MADMKPLKLTIENINSLRGRHIIDFRTGNLAGCDLFAIIGPTGSGKTTILDAITLALYGQACRYGGKSSPNDVMTTNTASSEATLLFTCADVTYEASWRLRRAREATDGAVQSPEASLKRVLSDGTIEVIAEQVVKARAVVENILGLNYEQFQRVALLPQGEFDRFLTAKDKERTQILEKLTGTAMYREIGEAIRKAFNLASSASQTLRDNISGLQKSLLDPADQLAKTELLAALDVLVPTVKKDADDLAARATSADHYVNALGSNVRYTAELLHAKKAWKVHQPQVARLKRFRALKPVFDAHRDKANAIMRLTKGEGDHKVAVTTAVQASLLAAVTRAQVLRYGRESMRTGLLAASKAAEAIGWKPFASISDAIATIQPIEAQLDAIRVELPQVARSKSDADQAWQQLWKQMTQVQSVVEAAGLDAEPVGQRERETAAKAVERAYTSMLATLNDQVTRERLTVDALMQSVASLSKVAELEERLVEGKDCPLCRQVVSTVPAKGTSATELDDLNARSKDRQEELESLESQVRKAGVLQAGLFGANGLIGVWEADFARAATDASTLDASIKPINLLPSIRDVTGIDGYLNTLTNVLTYSAAEALLQRVLKDGPDANDVAAGEQALTAWASMEEAVEVYDRHNQALTKAKSFESYTLEQVVKQTDEVKKSKEIYNAQLVANGVVDPAELDSVLLSDGECKEIEAQRDSLIGIERELDGKLSEVRKKITELEAVVPPLPATGFKRCDC
jgi:chromosome segregation ATPase